MSRWNPSTHHLLILIMVSPGLSVSYLSPLFHTLSVQFLIPRLSLSLSVYFRLPGSLRLTPSFLSLGLNPESAPGIREDQMFLRSSRAPGARNLKFKV